MPRLFKLGFDDRAGLIRYLQLRFVVSLMPKVKLQGGMVVTDCKGGSSSVYPAMFANPV